MKPLYIFDIDGTLANCQHRVPILSETGGDRWNRFYDACHLDTPIKSVIELMRVLYYSGADIWLFSGRSDRVRDKTDAWLREHTVYHFADYPDEVGNLQLVMRRFDDHRPDDHVKQEMLDNMLLEDRERLAGVFDDRDRVVAMWRAAGIPCYQVAPGDF